MNQQSQENSLFSVNYGASFSELKDAFAQNQIIKMDSDQESDITLYSYLNCDNNSPAFVKQCRGLVFQEDELKVKSFPYTEEYNDKESLTLKEKLLDLSGWQFYESYEGTLLRLFYLSGKWYLSTHRRLNAFRSKWSCSRSFGELFLEGLKREISVNPNLKALEGENPLKLESFCELLDKNVQYMFLVSNNSENRIVCRARNTVYYVGSFVNNNFSLENKLNFTMPEKLNFDSVDALVSFVQKIDYMSFQGVIGVKKTDTGVTQVKILNTEYLKLFAVRGNQPSRKYRYLQVRLNKDMYDDLMYLYPDSVETFNYYEKLISQVAVFIHRAYTRRFIKKEYVEVPQEEYGVIRECHEWHRADRDRNKVTLGKVVSVLNTQNATKLNTMIGRIKTQELNVLPKDYKGNNQTVWKPRQTA